MVRRAKTMKTLPDHRAADVDSLSDLGLFNLPRAAGQTLMLIAACPFELLSRLSQTHLGHCDHVNLCKTA